MSKSDILNVKGAEISLAGLPRNGTVVNAILLMEVQEVGDDGEILSGVFWRTSEMSNTTHVGMMEMARLGFEEGYRNHA